MLFFSLFSFFIAYGFLVVSYCFVSVTLSMQYERFYEQHKRVQTEEGGKKMQIGTNLWLFITLLQVHNFCVSVDPFPVCLTMGFGSIYIRIWLWTVNNINYFFVGLCFYQYILFYEVIDIVYLTIKFRIHFTLHSYRFTDGIHFQMYNSISGLIKCVIISIKK